MVSSGHVLTFVLFLGLPCWGYMFAEKHGDRGWMGAGLGLATVVAVLSGRLLWLMALDFRERKTYPNRADVGVAAKIVTAIIFTSSILTCVASYLRISHD